MRARFLSALLVLAACAPASAGVTLYAIGDGGASLLRFSSDSPSDVRRVGNFGGAAPFLDGIDFRPSTGQLYGYLSGTQSVYTVDTNSAALTASATLSASTNTFVLGIDFNPVADRLRIVTDSQQNLRANVATGATTVDGALTYAVGDVNENSPATLIADSAYTNSSRGIAASTRLYYIDYGLDILATTSNPNGGVLNTVGKLGVDTSELLGFDIYTSSNGENFGFAILTVGGVAGLYSIDLATGAATLKGELGAGFGNVYGLAVTGVPEPSTILLCGLGLALPLARSLRRKGPEA